MARIGIYGGSFNPVHMGHVQAAKYAIDSLGLDRLLVIPSSQTPGKQKVHNTPTDAHRLEMLKLAFESHPSVVIDHRELARGGISYTVDTLRELAKCFPEDELILFVGTDMFLSFLTWYCPEAILQYASLGVFFRGERNELEAIEKQKTAIEAMGGKVHLVKNPVTAISSTALRRMLVFGCADPFLPEDVGAYIRKNSLYDTGADYRGLSEEALTQVVTRLLKPSRVAHVLGCRQAAVELANLWGANPCDAARAALLHDITKALDGPLQLTLCEQYGVCLDAFSSQNPKTLHALTGSFVAERIFGENQAVVEAIRHHTTGKANMNVLETIIYVADYMEPNRDFPGVQALRDLAYTDLDGALKLGLEMTVSLLREQGRQISPESLDALSYLNTRKKESIC